MAIPSIRLLCAALLVVSAVGGCSGDNSSDPQGEEFSVYGSYTASIPASDFRGEPAAPPDVLKGEWTLHLGREFRLQQERFGETDGRLYVQGQDMFFDAQPAPAGTFNCFLETGRTTEFGEGRYSFTIDEKGIDLRAEDEPCPLREILLARTWKRL